MPYSRIKTSGTKEWADYNVNCIKGCYNNCRYCYAKMMAKRFKRSTDDTWKNMVIRRDILKKSFRKMSGRVMFPSSHDIINISPFKEACMTIMSKLLISRNTVLITTKPMLNVIKDIIDEFDNYHEQMQFRFTITSNDNKLLEFWEPNAPKFGERLSSLQYAFKKGYMTSVSIEPFLDYDPSGLIETVTPYTTESIWLGRMNYIPSNNLTNEEKAHYENIKMNYETTHLQELYHNFRKHSLIRFKDSIRIQLGE